jgi:tRNA(Ile)-lysidine synthase
MILKAVFMFDRFILTLTRLCGVQPGEGVLVCCSGGIDSMVLLRLMKMASDELGIRLHAVTIDHGLRCEAPGDARFVLDICSALGIEASLYELKMDPSISNLEEEARIRRYEAIMDCKEKLGLKFAATGHTADDQAETLIYRLVRGTGIRGMSGMDYARPDGLIRPMLAITGAEVESFAEANNISYVTDQTNADLTLTRNLIRKTILPVMREINPHAETAIARFACIAGTENAYINAETDNLVKRALLHDWNFCKVFAAAMLEDSPEALLRRMIIELSSKMLGDPRGIPATDVEQSLDVIRGETSAHTIMRKVRIQRNGNYLSFEKYPIGLLMSLAGHVGHDETQIVIRTDGVYSIIPINKQLEIKGIPNSLGATIRFYLPGDRMEGKKVTGIFQNKHIPLPLRKYWPVILLDHEIVSIAGLLDTNGIRTIFPYEG